jgi:predicted MPP superfamily phosphohydrolase
LVQIQGIHAKILLSVFSLLLLALVTYSGSGSFSLKALAASDTHIAAAGDWHCSSESQANKTLDNAKSKNPQLILGLGDYSDEQTDSCWVNLIKPVDSITKVAFGNHDDESDGLINSYLNHYKLSKQFYSFDIKNVHILTMATEDKFEAGTEQYNFVVNDLRNSANNPNIKWIIVNLHYPFYSSPNKCGDSDCAGNEELSQTYHPLFDKYGVDLVLQGHVHNYQRSFPLKFNQESSLKPIVTSTSKGEYKNPDGEIFAIVGTGGSPNSHDLSGPSPFMAYQQDSKFGILDMHFSENNLDAKFISNDGATMDHFSIDKTAKKKVIERISDDTATDTNVIEVLDKETTKAKPLTEQAKVQEDKPAVTFKLDEDAKAANTKTKPLEGQEVQDAKPSITFKLDEDAKAANTKAKPLAEQAEVQEDKPAITTKLDDNPPSDDKPMLLSEEQIKQEQEDKPAITTKLDDNSPTDDKPMSLGKEKVDSSDKDKPKSFQSIDNVDKSHVQDVLGTWDNDRPIDDAVSDSDEEKTIDTNTRDPFAAVN